MPAVSFLIPVRNAATTLDAALESVASQTFRDWEAILVDDASTDGSAALLDVWTRRDSRFRLLRQPEPLGIVAALSRALEAARAPVLARMDADDLSHPHRLERQLERLSAGDVAAVGCCIRYYPEEAVGDGARRYAAWLNSLVTPQDHERDLFVECPLAHPTMVLDAAALRGVGGYQDHGWPEDYDLLLRLWSAGHRLAKVPETLFLWRESAARTSRTHPHYTPEAFARCKAHYLRRTLLAGNRPAVLFGAGPAGKAIARPLLAAGANLTAFVDVDPRRIGQRLYGLPVLDHPTGFGLRGTALGLAAMGRPESREELRAALKSAGWREGEDFVCVS